MQKKIQQLEDVVQSSAMSTSKLAISETEAIQLRQRAVDAERKQVQMKAALSRKEALLSDLQSKVWFFDYVSVRC